MCAHVASYATNAAGDFSMATFWLEMYRAQLPLARARVKQLYGHAGGVFSETSYVWVSHSTYEYGVAPYGVAPSPQWLQTDRHMDRWTDSRSL